ncbi:YolD-like family protein [Paenibacillus chitinolyticus]|uniref:YolD-like family protein n=1 Tax=Paenibacillus chitinolyticus TaxID=79263 RepID=UPI00366B3BE3
MSIKLSENGHWESSRMMLPQHKEAINHQFNEIGLKRNPELHEDELQIVMENIRISFKRKTEICVTIYGGYELQDLIGVVTSINPYRQNFKIELVDGFEFIDFAEVFKVDLREEN